MVLINRRAFTLLMLAPLSVLLLAVAALLMSAFRWMLLGAVIGLLGLAIILMLALNDTVSAWLKHIKQKKPAAFPKT